MKPVHPRPKKRKFSGGAAGVQIGTYKRVAVQFSPEQVERINAIAKTRDWSFSKTVSALVDQQLMKRVIEHA